MDSFSFPLRYLTPDPHATEAGGKTMRTRERKRALLGVGETAQWLGALVASPEDSSWVPNTHTHPAAHNHL